MNRERAAHLRHQYRPPAKDMRGLGEEEPEKWPVIPGDYSIMHIKGPDAVPMDALNVDTINAVSWNLGVFRWFWYALAVSAAGAFVYWVVTPHIPGFDFASSEVNEAMARKLYRGEFINGVQNVVLIGGPGTGKSHVATALGVQAMTSPQKGPLLFHGRSGQRTRTGKGPEQGRTAC